VLEAIGIPPALARGAITIMFGTTNADGDPDRVAAALAVATARLRALSPL
jgi:cysteine sulfinate desulfinase/cysteine desulfurase-like protein